ncbi:hypothetical protein Dester_0908 [Desulfurobacterium thermolithotrophum DSM 11699]|uniref:Cytochrome c domain-containing protein n=1 Tax=Desulfurobacterium thermolithotrophum (strain DSM 11699 / BSA) TaxID=868864 RepID=F0S3X6_DESTD|nr:hypothetical protein [Desulfurobacterium thermolithotrophum]ADY73548.1 hypothetical protein Dester_0908 [Desulfurobacterium thermolithotrophum DSM 11699]
MRRTLGMALAFILSSTFSAIAAHPDVTLKDQFGKPVSESGLPVDIRQSCSACHDIDFIATAYHFQQGRLAILSPDIYQKYYEKYGDTQFTNGLPKELTKLDMGMYGKL